MRTLFELEHDNKIINRVWTNIRKPDEIQFSIEEAYRGNVQVLLTYLRYNRAFTEQMTVQVPWTNKQLSIEYGTFRDKLAPGQEEEWQLKISGPKNEKVAAEMVATMYDASLDAFAPNSWHFNLYGSSGYAQRRWTAKYFNEARAALLAQNWQPTSPQGSYRNYRQLNWFGFAMYEREQRIYKRSRGFDYSVQTQSAPAMKMEEIFSYGR